MGGEGGGSRLGVGKGRGAGQGCRHAWLAGLWGTMALSVLAALFIGVARRRWVALALLPLFGCCFLMCSYWLSGLLPQSF